MPWYRGVLQSWPTLAEAELQEHPKSTPKKRKPLGLFAPNDISDTPKSLEQKLKYFENSLFYGHLCRLFERGRFEHTPKCRLEGAQGPLGRPKRNL